MTGSIPTISRYVLGFILLISSISKWLNFGWFVEVLKKYDLTPTGVAQLTALTIASLEGIIGSMLILRERLPWSAYGALALFAIFTCAISMNLIRGKFDLECGCSGWWRRSKIGWHLVLRNLGFVGLSLISSEGSLHPMKLGFPWLFLIAISLVIGPDLISMTWTNRRG